MVTMVEHQAQLQNIAIKQEIDSDIPPIDSDPGQLQQVFLNLLNNAIYAVRNQKNGEIHITAKMDEEFISVAFTDNGCGISNEHLEKIFVPFFTTKSVGKGTGLGLSTCYGIVERLGGKIMVSSELDAGTVFTIWLPVNLKAGEMNDG
jgi:two-component system, NtrC family, sensor kinase